MTASHSQSHTGHILWESFVFFKGSVSTNTGLRMMWSAMSMKVYDNLVMHMACQPTPKCSQGLRGEKKKVNDRLTNIKQL